MNTQAAAVRWQRIFSVFALLVAVIALYWPSVQSLLVYWDDTDSKTYTHGYLIALLTVWLLWRQREGINAAPARPQWWAALGILLMGLLWLVSYRSAIQIGYQLLLPALMWGAIYAALGWRVACLCLFPLAYFGFAIPIWDSANGAAQWGTVVAVRAMLRAVGIPAYFDDHYVHIPSGTFEIAGGCSGLHFLIVALALSILLGELRRDSLGVRIKLAALAFVLALVTNWIRVFTIIIAGHLTNMQHYLVRVDHYYFGWALFAIAMAGFFYWARRVGAEDEVPRVQDHATVAGSAPIVNQAAIGALTVIALALPPVWGLLNTAAGTRVMAFGLSAYPTITSRGWSGPEATATDWMPEFNLPDQLLQTVYAQDGRRVEVSTAVYFSQRQGKELEGYGTSITGKGLRAVGDGQALAAGKPFNELTVEDASGESWVLWYGYQVDDRWFVDALRAQIWYGVSSLAAARPSRALMLRTRCQPDCATARRTLQTFIEQGVIG